MNQSTRQILYSLRKKAIAQGNQPFVLALETLIALIEREELREEHIPARQMLGEIDRFERSKTTKDDLLMAVLFYMESYGAAVRDVELSQTVEVLLDQMAEVSAKQ